MSEFQASNFKKENGGTPDLLGKTELTSPYFFVPPSGTTAERPQSCAAGTLRFNTDIGTLEIYRGDTIGWEQIVKRESQYLGGGTGSNTGTGTRALSMGGQVFPADINKIDFVTIPTLGDAQDFGDLSETRTQSAGLGSRVRGFCCGGLDSPSNYRDTIDSHEFSSTGNLIDYGDLTGTAILLAAFATSTRGVAAGGQPRNDVIDYFTMATTGTAKDFGDLPATDIFGSGLSSTTRGLIKDGTDTDNSISFVTISTTGDAVDYGDLSVARGTHVQTAANATRGIFAGGRTPSANNTIDFVTIATLGNAVDFGDLTRTSAETNAGTANPTRAIFMGNGPSNGDTIDLIEISTAGNATDFGNLTSSRTHNCACSNGHGGL